MLKSAAAQSTSSTAVDFSRLTASSSVVKIKDGPSHSEVIPKVSGQVRSLNYLAYSEIDEKSQGQAELTIGLKKEGFFFADVELTVGTFTEPRSVYIPFPEAYVAIGNEKSNYLAVGIKKQSLSFIDRYYNLGFYESYFTNDFIDYKEQGFAGLQFQVRFENFGIKGGYQPIFLKNQGPEVHEDSGGISSSNRWAKRPPKQFEFVQGQTRKIKYAIRDYSAADIIKNQGHTASVFIGTNSERPLVQVSYANHPLNEIPLTRETFGTISDFTGNVYLSPIVTNHEVRSADINLDRGLFKSTFSYLEDLPLNTNPLIDETLQVLKPLKVYSVYFAVDLKDYVSRPFSVSVAAAEMQGGEITDLMENGQNSVFTFSSNRSVFKKPLTFGLTGEAVYLGSKPLVTSIAWTYDREYKGTLVSTKLSHETWQKFYLHGGFDLLGVENDLQADGVDNFLNQNQANDRFFAGVQYVF